MDKIQAAFKNKKANIGYIVAGYPSVEHTKEFINNLNESCLDILEIGIPYSDPIADGKTIFEASFTAVQNGVNTDTVFEIVKECKTNKALVFLTYYNIIYAYGIEKFILRSKEAGISGLIIPDLPYEENEEIYKLCKKNNLCLIPLISITSEYRAPKLLKRSSGFVYAIGAIGVTGTKQTPIQRLKNMLKDLHKMTDLPIAIGFGVRTNEDVKKVRDYADGVIIGTSMVKLSKKYGGKEFIKEIEKLFEK